MEKIEHIGYVKEGFKSNFSKNCLVRRPTKNEEVESEGVSTSFFKSGPNKIELWQLQALKSDRFIDKKENSSYRLCRGRYRVRDARLQKEGFVVLNETPKRCG
jgi:methylmalonyl-CoA/ethylmalonyl-CoA epimerase